jgi:hypothetical protein
VAGNNQCKDLGMKPPLPRTLSAVPQTLHARLEIARAIRTLAGPGEDELLRQRRAEIAAIRRDLEALSRDLPKALDVAATLAKAELRAALKKYSVDQPRVPKHNPGGGRWTRDGAGNVTDHANGSAGRRNDSSAGGSADDANQSNKQIRVAAGLQCDGFPSGCQSGGSYGSSGMYNISGRVLCIDCAIKFFGLQDASQSERARTLDRFLIGK